MQSIMVAFNIHGPIAEVNRYDAESHLGGTSKAMAGCGERSGAIEERAREKHRSFGLFSANRATFHNIFKVVWRNPDFEGTHNIFGGSRSLHRHETRGALGADRDDGAGRICFPSPAPRESGLPQVVAVWRADFSCVRGGG
jgi:hypothetical protein